ARRFGNGDGRIRNGALRTMERYCGEPRRNEHVHQHGIRAPRTARHGRRPGHGDEAGDRARAFAMKIAGGLGPQRTPEAERNLRLKYEVRSTKPEVRSGTARKTL